MLVTSTQQSLKQPAKDDLHNITTCPFKFHQYLIWSRSCSYHPSYFSRAIVLIAVINMETNLPSNLQHYLDLHIKPSKEDADSRISETGLASFTYFPKLPLELRLRIWKAVSSNPRNIDLWLGKIKLGDMMLDENKILAGMPAFTSTSIPPAILQCCQESREEGLKNYRLSFGLDLAFDGGLRVSMEPRIYINWKVDRVCLMDTLSYKPFWFKTLFNLLKVSKLGSVAFAVDIWWDTEEATPCLSDVYQLFDPDEWLQPWLSEIPEVILFPSIYAPGSRTESLTANSLTQGGPGMVIQWVDFAKAFTSVKAILEDLRNLIQGRMKDKREKQQSVAESPAKAALDVITHPEPDIKICDVLYVLDASFDFMRNSRNNRNEDHEMGYVDITIY